MSTIWVFVALMLLNVGILLWFVTTIAGFVWASVAAILSIWADIALFDFLRAANGDPWILRTRWSIVNYGTAILIAWKVIFLFPIWKLFLIGWIMIAVLYVRKVYLNTAINNSYLP